MAGLSNLTATQGSNWDFLKNIQNQPTTNLPTTIPTQTKAAREAINRFVATSETGIPSRLRTGSMSAVSNITTPTPSPISSQTAPVLQQIAATETAFNVEEQNRIAAAKLAAEAEAQRLADIQAAKDAQVWIQQGTLTLKPPTGMPLSGGGTGTGSQTQAALSNPNDLHPEMNAGANVVYYWLDANGNQMKSIGKREGWTTYQMSTLGENTTPVTTAPNGEVVATPEPTPVVTPVTTVTPTPAPAPAPAPAPTMKWLEQSRYNFAVPIWATQSKPYTDKDGIKWFNAYGKTYRYV